MYHQGQSDLGLMRRDRKVNEVTGEVEDAKWLFHYKLELREVLAASGVNMDEYQSFLDAMDRLVQKGRALWDLAMDKFNLPHPNSILVLRCAYYDPPEEGLPSGAQCHWDRNDGTVHFAESEAGLLRPVKENFSSENPKMTVLPRAFHDVVHLFVSAKLAYLDPVRFKPVWHGGMSAKSGVSRWALVGFYHIDPRVDFPNEFNFRSKSRDPIARRVREVQYSNTSSR
jgi:hypothetical protein